MLFYRGMTRENVTIKATGGPRLPLMWPSRLVRVHFRAWRLSARGRWFLGEYAKRNRNADTRMVLDEVARIEQTLEALHQSTPDTRLTQILATIRNVVDQAIEMAASAADGLAIDDRLTPIRKGAKIQGNFLALAGNRRRIPHLRFDRLPGRCHPGELQTGLKL
jgi:hypothetical protein